MLKTTARDLSRESHRDKAAGCLVGLAIGDAFGDAARDPDNQFLYGITMDFPEKHTGSTDDTEFALLTAEILLRSKGNPTCDDVLHAWRTHVLEEKELKRGGASEREAASNIRRGILAPASGQFNSYSASDGAAMRAAPAGIIAAGNPDRAAELAGIDAEISHSGEGIWGAQAVAAAVAVAMGGGTVEDIFEEGMRRAPQGSWLRHNFRTAVTLMDKRGRSLHAVWMELHQLLRGEYKASAPEAVVSAFSVFLLAGGNFRSSIVYGGNFGRDSDTIGAIAGALAGSFCGLAAIPPDWVARTRRPGGTCLRFTAELDIVDVAEKLTALSVAD
jgi:ADP-ribosylglycohydrolase